MRPHIKRIFSLLFLFFVCNLFATEKDKINFGYYIQGDSVWFNGDTYDDVKNRVNFKNGVNIPRARFYVRGHNDEWLYVFTYDAAEEYLRENYVRYKGISNVYFQLGHYKPAYSIWYSTSHRFNIFMERALPVIAFVPGYRVGTQLLLFKDPLTFAMGIFGPDAANKLYGEQVKGHMPLAANTRFTFVPLHTENHVLHFGAAGVYQETDSTEAFRFRAFPEIQMYRNRFLIDTEKIPHCKHFYGHECEIAYFYRSFSTTGEYYSVFVDRQKQENVSFNGFYVMADYFLTGEGYKYNFREGLIDGITPIRHCFGALQLALRYSVGDLQDDDIRGGREYNKTLALNWYLNKHVRLVFNYVAVHTSPSQNGQDRNLNIVGLRCQLSA